MKKKADIKNNKNKKEDSKKKHFADIEVVDLKQKRILDKEKKVKKTIRKISGKKKDSERAALIAYSEKLDRQKRRVMWSAVVFFMMLILVLWIFKVKQEISFKALNKDNSQESFIEQAKKQQADLKNVIDGIKNRVSDKVSEQAEELKQISSSTASKTASSSQAESIIGSSSHLRENIKNDK